MVGEGGYGKEKGNQRLLFLSRFNDEAAMRSMQVAGFPGRDAISVGSTGLTTYEVSKRDFGRNSGICSSKCGYPAINASYYDLSYHPTSTSKDCKLYKNARNVKCYDCDSCKAGVAQHMKTEWRVVAIFNVILFVILSAVYLVACCARRNAASSNSLKEGRR